ncbi:MAG: metallophosphoesterase [Ruminococcaceae bacterium]|nr:metallophosphoesterase [Oscillospiraceae bacterium]
MKNNLKKLFLSLAFLSTASYAILKVLKTDLTVRQLVFKHRLIPKNFDGFRIVHLSDFHNNSRLSKKSKLSETVKGLSPDAVFMTGDMSDNINGDIFDAVELCAEISEHAEIYYVLGNHESVLKNRKHYCKLLEKHGVTLLTNKTIKITRNREFISVAGIIDPHFFRNSKEFICEEDVVSFLMGVVDRNPESFEVLLSHRPEFFHIYCGNGFDLVFSGHAHGGQWNLPLIGPVYSPNQGLFPELTSGIYQRKSCSIVVSRGLGDSIFPIRINNPYEIILLTLKSEG